MYLPYQPMTAQEDQIGNLQVWIGDNTPKPKDESKIAYLQYQSDKETLFDYCFDLTQEDLDELGKGYVVTLNVHVELIAELFC